MDGETDKLLDRYDWYAPGVVILGWSPIKGEVAVMAVTEERGDDWREQEEFRFSVGGRLLKAYTAADLLALGADEKTDLESGRRGAAFRAVGCEQVPNTNEYNFVVNLGKDWRLTFLNTRPFSAS